MKQTKKPRHARYLQAGSSLNLLLEVVIIRKVLLNNNTGLKGNNNEIFG